MATKEKDAGAGIELAADEIAIVWQQVMHTDLPALGSASLELDVDTTAEIIAAFLPELQMLRHHLDEAASVTVEDEFDTEGMEEAKRKRINIKNSRNALDKIRERMKAHANSYGNGVQQVYNLGKQLAEPAEEKLKVMEETAIRAEAKRKNDIRLKREDELRPFVQSVMNYNLADMSPEAYAELLESSKIAHAARLKREEEERLAEQQRQAEQANALEKARQEAHQARQREAQARAEAETARREAEEARQQAQQAQQKAVQFPGGDLYAGPIIEDGADDRRKADHLIIQLNGIVVPDFNDYPDVSAAITRHLTGLIQKVVTFRRAMDSNTDPEAQ